MAESVIQKETIIELQHLTSNPSGFLYPNEKEGYMIFGASIRRKDSGYLLAGMSRQNQIIKLTDFNYAPIANASIDVYILYCKY